MFKKISLLLYSAIKFIDLIVITMTKRSLLNYFKEFLQNDSYKSINILNKNTIFFMPNNTTEWRIKSFFTKEPETLDWIDGF